MRYSFNVVAPINCSSPRAREGFKMWWIILVSARRLNNTSEHLLVFFYPKVVRNMFKWEVEIAIVGSGVSMEIQKYNVQTFEEKMQSAIDVALDKAAEYTEDCQFSVKRMYVCWIQLVSSIAKQSNELLDKLMKMGKSKDTIERLVAIQNKYTQANKEPP